MMLIVAAIASLPPLPSYWACTTSELALPFCNTALSIDQRVDDLVGRLTLAEKVAMIGPNGTLGNECADHTTGVPRLGVPQWMWLTETNTAVNSACFKPGVCATTFPGPMNMGASFNRTSWRAKGGVLGSEMRAFHNMNWQRNIGDQQHASLIAPTGFGPNINIARDPRFGRSSELPGEDERDDPLIATDWD